MTDEIAVLTFWRGRSFLIQEGYLDCILEFDTRKRRTPVMIKNAVEKTGEDTDGVPLKSKYVADET